jgi:bacteriocin-type signal sequence
MKKKNQKNQKQIKGMKELSSKELNAINGGSVRIIVDKDGNIRIVF